MSLVEVRRASYAHTDAVPLLREVDLRFDPGFTGVVGANGAGKTTLLQLLTGEIEPDTGVVRRHPASLEVRLCPQRVEALTDDVCTFGAARAGGARKLRGRLDLEPADLARWPSLSPGERKRWQIGAALAEAPGLLLLDEPTNHLDGDARERLIAALRDYEGIGVLVSHDRTLLEALCQNTLRFHAGEVRLWRGGYASARAAWEQEERERRGAERKLQHEKRKARKRLATERQGKAQASAKMARETRRAPIADSDTRLRYGAKRRRSADVTHGRNIQKLHGKLGRLEEALAGFHFEKERGRELFVDYEPAGVETLFELDAPGIRAGDRVLLGDVSLRVRRGSRIHIAGPNGAGKTTLLHALLAAAHIPASRVLHLPQELASAAGREALAALGSLSSELRVRVLHIVAALGVDPAVLLRTPEPSPGEARKLLLAQGLARRVWALVLDEPTNHLDLPSIERLESALAGYPGALVVVTHDVPFAARLTDEVWSLEGGAVLRAHHEI